MQEVDSKRLPVVPVVVVTEVDSMGVPVVVLTEPPDEPCVGPVSPKFLFQVRSNFFYVTSIALALPMQCLPND